MIDEQTRAILKTLRVLYVEDEEDIRNQLIDSFNRKFGQVHIASNGEEGLAAYEKHRPDIVVTDIKMPVMDGLTMITRIRENDSITPIIVITAYSELENLKRALELDVDRFIQKPPVKAELDRALYKATETIIKQKEIEDRDRIIQTILGWQPYFSIICNETNIKHVTADFLGFLGFSDQEDFLQNFKDMEWLSGNHNNLESVHFDSAGELFKYLTLEQSKKHFITLKNHRKKINELFEVRARYYDTTALFLLSLFSSGKTDQ